MKHKILIWIMGIELLGTIFEYLVKDYIGVGIGIICMWITAHTLYILNNLGKVKCQKQK